MPDEVIISTTALLYNELGIIQHKGRENKEDAINVKIKDDLGPEEDVEESSESKPHKRRHEESSHIKECAFTSQQGCHGEADEDNSCASQCSGDDDWIDHNNHVKQRTKGDAHEKAESCEDANALPNFFFGMSCGGEPQHQTH